MCGRSASSRNANKVSHACAYLPRGGTKAIKPPWSNCSALKYHPSYNVSPQMNTPVLLSNDHSHIRHFSQTLSPGSDPIPMAAEHSKPISMTGDRVLQVMKWGLVPSWRKSDGGGKSPSPLLNNCRLESMFDKPSFKNAVEKRRRCVVLVDGFFEWDRKGKQKRPYLVHFRDNAPTSEMKAMEELKEEGEGSTGANLDQNVVNGRLLSLAGLFDICVEKEEDEPLYTYTIITMEAHPDFASIHDRMPVVLDGEEAIRTWLDPSHSTGRAVEMVCTQSSALTWYPVSAVVNNVKNKSPECIMKVDPRKEVSRNQKTITSWFSKQNTGVQPSKKKLSGNQGDDKEDNPPAKKLRLDQ